MPGSGVSGSEIIGKSIKTASKLWMRYKEKILDEMLGSIIAMDAEKYRDGVIEKIIDLYVLAKMDMYKHDSLVDSITTNDFKKIIDVIEQGWDVSDIVCRYSGSYPSFHEIEVLCETPNNEWFKFVVSFKDVDELSKNSFEKYMIMKSWILLPVYKKVIRSIVDELRRTKYELEEYIHGYEDEDEG